MPTPHSKKIIIAIIALGIVGVIVSGYMLALHYKPGPSFCATNGVVNCDTVNKGPYGDIGGVPVSLIGLLGYAALAGAAGYFLKTASRGTLDFLRYASTLAFFFSLWLLYLELFVILAICPFCMTSLILIILITGLAWGVEPSSQAIEKLNINHRTL